MYFYTIIPNLLFGVIYHIYLPKKYGGTPGKLIVGIKIIKLNGKPITWKEAILRESVMSVILFQTIISTSLAVLKADEATLISLNWKARSEYLTSLAPSIFIPVWLKNIWYYGELIVLLTNSRKRAIHDYIAGTVIVKSIYIDAINKDMYPENAEERAILS